MKVYVLIKKFHSGSVDAEITEELTDEHRYLLDTYGQPFLRDGYDLYINDFDNNEDALIFAFDKLGDNKLVEEQNDDARKEQLRLESEFVNGFNCKGLESFCQGVDDYDL